MSGNTVKLYIYEISNGFARQMSPLLLGKQIDGIWHTGVVCYGREYFFGGMGISHCIPGGTVLGEPDKVIDLGETQIPEDVFTEFLKGLGSESFRADKYHLFDHNCNAFSNELTLFLTGRKIPKQIRNLPHEIANSAFGQMIKPIVDSMTVTPAGGSSISNHTQTTNRTLQASTSSTARTPSDSQNPESIFEPRDSLETAPANSSLSQVRVPAPEIFQAKDVREDIKIIKEAYKDHTDERKVTVVLNDLENLIIKGKKVTVKDDHVNCLENIFQESSGKDYKKNVLELLKALTLERTFVNHLKVTNVVCGVISNLLELISQQDARITIASLQILCNFASTKSGHEVLTSIKTQPSLLSVITTCLLHEEHDNVNLAASELAFNIARYKVSEDVGFECATALLEVMNRKLDTNTTYNLLFSICQFMKCSSEVSGLVQALGVDFNQYIGQSADIDELCHDIKILLKQQTTNE